MFVYGEAVEALVRIGTFLLQLKSGNWVALVSDLTDGDSLTVETIQDWERRWFPNSLQAVKTSEFSVAAARWGATEPGVETEKLSDGRLGVTVRVYRGRINIRPGERSKTAGDCQFSQGASSW